MVGPEQHTDDRKKLNGNRVSVRDMAIGLAMGAGIGITTGNLPVGMAGGLALGLAISAKRRRKYEDHG